MAYKQRETVIFIPFHGTLQKQLTFLPENSGTDKPSGLASGLCCLVFLELGAALETLGDSGSLAEVAVADLKETFDCC